MIQISPHNHQKRSLNQTVEKQSLYSTLAKSGESDAAYWSERDLRERYVENSHRRKTFPVTGSREFLWPQKTGGANTSEVPSPRSSLNQPPPCALPWGVGEPAEQIVKAVNGSVAHDQQKGDVAPPKSRWDLVNTSAVSNLIPALKWSRVTTLGPYSGKAYKQRQGIRPKNWRTRRRRWEWFRTTQPYSGNHLCPLHTMEKERSHPG